MTITKRNKVHRRLAALRARLSCYLGEVGEIPGETETPAEYVTRTSFEYVRALTLSVPALRREIEAARATINCCPYRISGARENLTCQEAG